MSKIYFKHEQKNSTTLKKTSKVFFAVLGKNVTLRQLSVCREYLYEAVFHLRQLFCHVFFQGGTYICAL